MSESMNLVADIGATNARFQLSKAGALVGEPVRFATASFSDCRTLVARAYQALGAPQVHSSVFAVAGPVLSGGDIEVTNTGLRFAASVCAQELGGTCKLVNDFFALAHAVPHFTGLQQLGGKAPPPVATKFVLGPGTGLGMATIVRNYAAWQVLPSEGGHADLAPGSHLEAELWGVLMHNHGHVSWETVLCGSGLQNLYVAMCGLWGSTPETLSPADITARGISMQDPVCHQTLETFCALLGAVAGNMALAVTALGGVYVGGGIVPQMLEFVLASPLRRRFEERGQLSDFVQPIPLYFITADDAGLEGALQCLSHS